MRMSSWWASIAQRLLRQPRLVTDTNIAPDVKTTVVTDRASLQSSPTTRSTGSNWHSVEKNVEQVWEEEYDRVFMRKVKFTQREHEVLDLDLSELERAAEKLPSFPRRSQSRF